VAVNFIGGGTRVSGNNLRQITSCYQRISYNTTLQFIKLPVIADKENANKSIVSFKILIGKFIYLSEPLQHIPTALPADFKLLFVHAILNTFCISVTFVYSASQFYLLK
jgi:hypothetical protein